MKNELVNIAKQFIACFLKKPVSEISCTLLIGGSEEDAIVKCMYQSESFIVKLFKDKQASQKEIAWTRHASDLGIGPKLYYADDSLKYMIIEFVNGKSLVPDTANSTAVIKDIAIKTTQLHQSSFQRGENSDMFARIDGKYKKLNSSDQLKSILEDKLADIKNIKILLQRFSMPLAPCHNDLNWGNIFVNNNKIVLIDWGDSALANPYYDIAAFLVLNVINQENEKLFLEQYNVNLLQPEWQKCMASLKQVVYFEFALNLLAGVQEKQEELLHQEQIKDVSRLNYYLPLLAKREAKIDSLFLYTIALASLNEIHYIQHSD